MKIVLAPSFVHDLNTVKEYLEDKTEVGFMNIKSEVFNKIKRLLTFPESGTKMTNKDAYRIVDNKYNYKIYYKIRTDLDEIHITRLIHSKRNLKI